MVPVLAAVKEAISRYGKPEIINSDQGSQFTSDDYTEYLKSAHIRQSMDGKARWVDNVVIERRFRSLKTERIYPYEFLTPRALRAGIQVRGRLLEKHANSGPLPQSSMALKYTKGQT